MLTGVGIFAPLGIRKPGMTIRGLLKRFQRVDLTYIFFNQKFKHVLSKMENNLSGQVFLKLQLVFLQAAFYIIAFYTFSYWG